MTTARHIAALLQSHFAGDEDRVLSVATHRATLEARQGHGKLAQELQALINAAKGKGATVGRHGAAPASMAQPKGELTSLLAARYSDICVNSMVLTAELKERIVLVEQRHQARLRARRQDLHPTPDAIGLGGFRSGAGQAR